MQPLDNVKEFYNSGKNRNIINAFVIGLVIAVGGYFGYKYLYQMPREKKASDKIFWAQETFAKDSADLALKGDPGSWGLGHRRRSLRRGGLPHPSGRGCAVPGP